jgi:hypothetical protein
MTQRRASEAFRLPIDPGHCIDVTVTAYCGARAYLALFGILEPRISAALRSEAATHAA